MKRRTGFYSVVLTSVVCMLGWMGSGMSAVRILGANTDAGSDSSNGTSTTASAASTASTRASSIRFTPTVTTKTDSSAQPTSGTADITSGAASARLSIGKYLNLSHSTKTTPSSGSGGGSSSSVDIDGIRSEIDLLKNQVEAKQNALVVSNDEYIEITGPDNNVISIDIEALKGDLQVALGTDKDILVEIDDDYKLWWCYANEAKTGCSSDRQQVVDLGALLDEYNLAEKNVSLKTALAGKQGKLTASDNGYIAINQESGAIGLKFDELKNALGISDAKQSEIRFTEDGKLQWRYVDEFESDGRTKKWSTADISKLVQDSLENYVQTQTLEDYVLKSELSGLTGALVPDSNGYIKIENNQIGVKFDDLRAALNIPQNREIEMEVTQNGVLQWRYLTDFQADGVTKKWTVVSESLGDIMDGKLALYALKTDLEGLQGTLTPSENGYIEIDGNEIGIKFDDLKTALNIPEAASKIEMEITDGGTLRWRYVDSFEADGVTKKWTNVSKNISDIMDGKLVLYALKTDLEGLQGTLTPSENGYIEIEGNEIGIKFDDLKTALNIPNAASKIEMEITDGGTLRWRYVDSFEADGVTKKWTNVSKNISDIMDGKLVLYALKTDLEGLQGALTPSENGYIEIEGDEIGIKFDDLKTALNIPKAAQKIEMEITEGGTLRWRYLDEFEADGVTKKWTLVSENINTLIDTKLANYVTNDYLENWEGNLTADDNGYLQINDKKIGVKLAELRNALNIPEAAAKIEMEITEGGTLRWRYLNEFEADGVTKKWTLVSENINTLIDTKLANYVTNDYLENWEGNLTADDNGYLQINDKKIGVKLAELRNALNIPEAAAKIEMEITEGGTLRWRYLDEFESDGKTKKWTNVSENINTLIDTKLANYVTNDYLENWEGNLTADDNGYLQINDKKIGVKLAELRDALNIPEAAEKIEMEITEEGTLRWRYLNEFESDGKTKKWTNVSENINTLIDGKLANYVDNTTLQTTLNNYITNSVMTETLKDYATKTYVDEGLATKQTKLTEADNGFIKLTPVEGSETIGIKFNELKAALNIPEPAVKIEMQVNNGVFQWRYLNEFEEDGVTKKWTTVYNLKSLLDDYVTQSDFNLAMTDINNRLNGKQMTLTPTENGGILLNQQTGEIAVDMEALRNYLALSGDLARTSEIRVEGDKLQWRYLDEFEADGKTKIWHDLDLSGVLLPYVTNKYLTENYYTKTDVDSLAERIETNINLTLQRLALPDDGPTDSGLYLLSVTAGEEGADRVSVWQTVHIVDDAGNVH